MALQQYDIGNVAKNKQAVTETVGSSIGTSAVRLTIDTTYAPTRVDALQAIAVITQKIREGNWPSV